VEEMTPTTSQGQLRRREAGWEGSRRRNRDPRDTWSAAAGAVAGCAYEAGRSGRAGRLRRSPLSSRGRRVDAVGVRGRLLVLPREISAGVPDAPSGWVARWFAASSARLAGWGGTVVSVRTRLAVEKSAEAVVPAGSMFAGKSRTRSRGAGRPGLVGWTMTAANPARGLDGRTGG